MERNTKLSPVIWREGSCHCILSFRRIDLFRRSDKEHVVNLTLTKEEFITSLFSFRKSDKEHIIYMTMTEKEVIIPFSYSAGVINDILRT